MCRSSDPTVIKRAREERGDGGGRETAQGMRGERARVCSVATERAGCKRTVWGGTKPQKAVFACRKVAAHMNTGTPSTPPPKCGTALGKGWALLVRVLRASCFPLSLAVKIFHCHQYRLAVGLRAGWGEPGDRSPACALGRSREGPLLKQCKAAGVQQVGSTRSRTWLRLPMWVSVPPPPACTHAHVFQHDPTCSRVCISLLGSILSCALCPLPFLSSLLLL